jgi:hypothetical protein
MCDIVHYTLRISQRTTSGALLCPEQQTC